MRDQSANYLFLHECVVGLKLQPQTLPSSCVDRPLHKNPNGRLLTPFLLPLVTSTTETHHPIFLGRDCQKGGRDSRGFACFRRRS